MENEVLLNDSVCYAPMVMFAWEGVVDDGGVSFAVKRNVDSFVVARKSIRFSVVNESVLSGVLLLPVTLSVPLVMYVHSA